jgi:hypothetical protein
LITFYPPWELPDFDKHIRSANVSQALEGLAKSCIDIKPTNRPDFETIVIILQSGKELDQAQSSELMSYIPMDNRTNTSYYLSSSFQTETTSKNHKSKANSARNNDSSAINTSLLAQLAHLVKLPSKTTSKQQKIALSRRNCFILAIM